MLQDNQRLGEYLLIRRIASGGMADVYVAQSYLNHELYAIKVIHNHLSRDRELIQMLIDEGRLTQLLKHPHIVDVKQLSQVGEEHFIVMELIQGRDIYQTLITLDQQGRKMPLEIAVMIIIEACSGLHYAHTASDPYGRPLNVIHRDVSPQNILISYDGVTKLIDFGIAKASQRDSYTQQGVLKGKYYYMSPEQAWGDQVDLRSDLFSLGICLYEMIAGEMLYSEEDGLALLEQVRRAEIPPLAIVRPDAPPQLEQILRRALAPEPHQRFQSAEEMRLALDTFLKGYAPGVTSPSHLRRFMWDLFGPPPDPTSIPENQEEADFGSNQEATKAVNASAFAQLVHPQSAFQDEERTRAVSATSYRQLTTPQSTFDTQERTRAVSAEMMASLSFKTSPLPTSDFNQQERTRAVSAEMMAKLAPPSIPSPSLPKLTTAPVAPSFNHEERTRAVNANQMMQELNQSRSSSGPHIVPRAPFVPSPNPSPNPHFRTNSVPHPAPSITPTPTPYPAPQFNPAPAPAPAPAPSPIVHQNHSLRAHPSDPLSSHQQESDSASSPFASPPSQTPPERELKQDSASQASEVKPKKTNKKGNKKKSKKGKSYLKSITLKQKLYFVASIGFLIILGVLIAPKMISSSIPDHIQLLITSIPQGAQVILDGKDTGQVTPASIHDIKINEKYRFEIKMKGYENIERVISWNEDDYKRKVNKKDQSLEERIILERSPGQLVVYSDPQGAKVYLNGDLLGTTPLNKTDIKRDEGELMLLVKHPKYQDPVRTIFKWGEEAQKSFTLKMVGRRTR